MGANAEMTAIVQLHIAELARVAIFPQPQN
jgi:hypothetical protein